MLNFLNHFSVPGVDHVTVYHDDQDPNLYYTVPELPSLLTRDDGSPSFTLISFARDFTLLADSASQLPTAETEGGLLQLTTSLEVSDADQQTIREYIAGGMDGIPRPSLRGRRLILLRPGAAVGRDIKLAYPTWVDGKVAFHLFPSGGDTFVKALQGSEKPSLVASNLASYTALLGQEGLRLIRSSIEDGWSPGTINYDMSFVARIPSLSVKVWGESHDVYQEIKDHTTVTETYRSGNRVRTYQYPQVSSLDELRDISTSLHIEYDVGDFRGGGEGEDPTKALEDVVFTMVQQLITTRFLSPGFEPGLKAEKLGTDPLAHGGGEKMPAGNQLWLKDFEQSMDVKIDFTFSGSTNFLVEKHPNSELFALVGKEQVKKSIIEADLSKPYFTLLDVPVQVTADFDRDPIAAIKVFLEYDHEDEKGAGRKRQVEEFLFDANEDRYFFRTVMARAADGTPKDTYTYRSEIIYKASATSEKLAPVTTNDRNLIIGYDQLNCVNVAVYWGAIPTDAVQQVQVSFRYPGVQLPSATADVVLRLDAPQGSWFTYTGENASPEYEYDVTFFMADGQRIALPTQKASTQRLIINAPFEDKLAATFVPQGTFPPVASIVVTTKYVDGDYEVGDVHPFTAAGEVWEWRIDLRDRAKRTFQYRVDVTYADGSSSTGEWQEGAEGTVLVGDVARDMLKVEIVTDLVDMTKWKLVIVRLAYDAGDGTTAEHIVKLTAAPPAAGDLVWTVPITDPARRGYTYQIQAFGNAGERHLVEPTPATDPLLVLEF
ncbi:hypothetical protein [Microbacterium kyungheense]|uniref:Uncharacterized protein n=1 Tax=Microbacterium kyungheense TaxID=1263636 RepID=A0A543FLV5_9MICO|nr:hypothetical protein [Microbacterium kyungheense]TQM34831.1 hypothetical protein FB391_1124 [Microbacterium kyungheense]